MRQQSSRKIEDHSAYAPGSELIGRVLGGRYRFDHIIATGGSATVFSATDTALSRPVAAKVVTRPGQLGSEALRDALNIGLRAEASACMRLAHPNIVRVYNYEQEDGLEMLIMEHLRGYTLTEVRKRFPDRRVPVEQIPVIARALLEALAAAHAAGVVHHDVKPGNLVWSEPGQLKLIDFGLARVEGESAPWQDGMVAGTPAFVSPERLLGNEGDPRSDLFSAAATLYLLATGHPPFGRQPEEVARNLHRRVQPAPGPLPGALYAVLCTALEVAPSDRYQSASQMLEDLENVVLQRSEIRPHIQVSETSSSQIDVDSISCVVSEELQTNDWEPSSMLIVDDVVAAREGPLASPMVRVAGHGLQSQYDGRHAFVEFLDVDVFLVTNQDYARFLADTGELPPSYWLGDKPPRGLERHPVVEIRLAQARAFADWAGKRLLSPLEWEAVARGAAQRRFPWGAEADAGRWAGPDGVPADATVPVDAYPESATPEGCLGLLGNVWEWTEPEEPGVESAWVFGGSFRHPAIKDGVIARSSVGVRSAYRYVGFRCARDVR